MGVLPEVLKLFDGYVHGRLSRRDFLKTSAFAAAAAAQSAPQSATTPAKAPATKDAYALAARFNKFLRITDVTDGLDAVGLHGRGLMDPDIHPSRNWVQILINPAKNTHRCRDEEVETLIHELAHVIMPKTTERGILRIEAILSRKFSVSQRRYLKSFIPRHEVKHYPRIAQSGRIATA